MYAKRCQTRLLSFKILAFLTGTIRKQGLKSGRYLATLVVVKESIIGVFNVARRCSTIKKSDSKSLFAFYGKRKNKLSHFKYFRTFYHHSHFCKNSSGISGSGNLIQQKNRENILWKSSSVITILYRSLSNFIEIITHVAQFLRHPYILFYGLCSNHFLLKYFTYGNNGSLDPPIWLGP